MPIRLKPPRPGKSPFWTMRGSHLGVYVDRSTKALDRATARKVLTETERQIERDLFEPAKPAAAGLTFFEAAIAYIAGTGVQRYLPLLIDRLGPTPVSAIDQTVIDQAALALYPKATAATRNRQVYTPVSAVLKHNGVKIDISRPKGWRGKARVDWMQPEQAARLIAAAGEADAEFGLFLAFLLYTGCRLSEAAALTCDRLSLRDAYALAPVTKNGDPRGIHLPPVLVAALANHPRGLERGAQKLFRFTKCGRIYTWINAAKHAAGPDLDFVTFHTFRHTWATWMRRYGGLDTRGLVDTGAWRDMASAARYEHVIASEEAKRADQLPIVEIPWEPAHAKAK
jgi:integrase